MLYFVRRGPQPTEGMWRRANDFAGWHDWTHWMIKASRELARVVRSIASCHEQRIARWANYFEKIAAGKSDVSQTSLCPLPTQSCVFLYKNIISRNITTMFLARRNV